MSSAYPALPRPSVRDSFDEDDLSDVDDEVFIRDGKNGGLKLDDEGGVKRPLMAPRRKLKTSRFNNGSKFPHIIFFAPFCYGILALGTLFVLIAAFVYSVNRFPIPMSIMGNWLSGTETKSPESIPKVLVPCTSLGSKVVWTRTLPKFTSEAPFRGNDVNGDNVEDIIVGFSTGLDAMDAPEYLCDLYFGGTKPCLGGIMALDGKSGDTVWIYWTAHAIFNVDCGIDLTGDGVNDCLITGRGGIFHAVDGSLGTNVWKLNAGEDAITPSEESILDVYDAARVSDVDGDDIGDIVASHTVQSGESRSSEILVISGKTGTILSRVDFPKKEELFIAPRALFHPDGEVMLVLVSSTPEKSGGLYVVSHGKLLRGHLQLHELYWGKGKGILLPPILSDITSDGTSDIIVATVNATIAAFDGLTLQPIWNYTVPGSEIISIPIPGYYDDDQVPDFMVKHQVGPGYPLYYYTVSTVLNGKTGRPLLEKPLVDSLSGQMSGLSVTVEDFGNDWFLHWSSNCLDHEGAREKYRFLHGQSLISQSRADLCRLIYNTTLVTRLWALSQHVEPPGQSLYYSEDWKNVEYNNSIDPREQADAYNRKTENFDDRTFDSELNIVSERSPRFDKNHRKTPNSRNDVDEISENVDFYDKRINDGSEIPSIVVDDEFPERYENSESKIYDRYGKSGDNNFRRKSEGNGWLVPKDWRNDEIRREKQYDGVYEDGEDEMVSAEENDVREQRSDSTANELTRINVSDVDNDKYDANMDYTNGGRNYVGKSPISFVRSVVSALPDVKKNRVDVESTKRRKSESIGERERFRRGVAFSQFDDEYANIENVFKRESMRNFLTESKATKRRKFESSTNGKFVGKGIQRQPPTGILLPSISRSNGKNSIDLIFSTYWLPPSQVSLLLVERDLDCIRSKRSKNLENFDTDEIVAECLAERGVDYRLYQEGTSRENVKIPLGQMTIYRIRLECNCPDDMIPGLSCKNVSHRQSWSAHLGESGNGFFRPFRKSIDV